jgi:D-lactate dehydrogenase (cytochrome)
VQVESFLSALRDGAGSSRVLSDKSSCEYYANDVFWQPGVVPLAIVLPENRAQAVAAVKAAAAHGVAIVPRGGGMSYSKGYLPERSDSVVVDTRKLNRVLEVNVADRYVTVEAGCTWAQLHEALLPTGMSTAYWGPLSGINATVGGALSQNSAFFGSTLHGTVAAHVLGVTVLLASGDVVTTGSGGRVGTKPFTRYAGPDMTGLFLGDTGAFGLKLAATLRLEPAARHLDYLGFGFEDMRSMALAQVEMSALRAISEGFGIDRAKALNWAALPVRPADCCKASRTRSPSPRPGPAIWPTTPARSISSCRQAVRMRWLPTWPPCASSARNTASRSKTPRRESCARGRSIRCVACWAPTASAGCPSTPCFR